MISPSLRKLPAALFCLAMTANGALAREAGQEAARDSADETESPRILQDQSQTTSGSITIKGPRVTYQAEAGIEVVYLKDPKDDDPAPRHDEKAEPPPIPQHAAMSYVAYFKGDHADPSRPITFLFNGGSSPL